MKFDFPNLDGRTVAADTESTGLCWWKNDELFGVAIAYREREAGEMVTHYFDVRYPEVRHWMADAFTKVKLWVNHYIKHDAHFMREAGFDFPADRLSCTMIREALIDENKYEYGLDALSHKYLNYGKVDVWEELAAMFGGNATKQVQILNLAQAPEELVARYAKQDAANALLIWERQEAIIERESLRQIERVEMRLLEVIISLEQHGVRVDLELALRNHKKLHGMIREMQARLNTLAGFPVNVNSSLQKKVVLGVHQREDGHWYTKDNLKLEKTDPSKTHPKGQAKLDSVRMQQSSLPEAQLLVDIAGHIKARDTFLEQYMLNLSHNGLVHASFNQSRTEDGNGIYTGRISISEPALQQIHKRNKVMAAIVRACFIPTPGSEWWCFDWSQMDFRIFAHFLNDYRINEMYKLDRHTDFHKLVAGLTGLPRDRDQRTGGANAKQINLACVFGMGPGELAKQCNLPYTVSTKGYLIPGPEAKALFAKYHDNIPGVRTLQNSVESVAKSRGYITTQLGRRIRFPGGRGAHKAAGLLYQATAADAMKIKMIDTHNYLKSCNGYQGRLMMTVHDEFDLDMQPQGPKSTVKRDLTHILESFNSDSDSPVKFRVPIIADFGSGVNWHEASK